VYADMNSSDFRRDLNVPKVLADLVDSDREFHTVGAATANDRSDGTRELFSLSDCV